jgi:glycosyltransferase involved in cell wall biosynthesis
MPGIRTRRIPNFVGMATLPGRSAAVGPERTLLYLGWVIPTKGIGELVQAWSELDPAGWRLHIVGPMDPAYGQGLLDRHHPSRLSFEGGVEHREALVRMAAADAFVLPSYTEGFPNVLLEAMALGKPILATDVGEIAGMLGEDGGMIIPPRSTTALKDALATFLSDPPLRERLGRRALERAARFDMETVLASLKAQWRAVASRPGPLRVCLFAPMPPPYGGIAHWTTLVLRRLARRDEVRVRLVDVAPLWKGLGQKRPLNRLFLGALKSFDMTLSALWRLATGDSVLHLTTSGHLSVARDVLILGLARLFRRPAFYHLHFGRMPQILAGRSWERRGMVWAIGLAHTVLPIDKPSEEALVRHFPGKRVFRLPNCIDPLEGVVPLPDPGGRLRALYLGWVVPTKGIEELMEAWTRLAPRGWVLDIAGPEDPLFLARLRHLYPLEDVQFLGSRPHPEAMALLAGAEFLVLPSHSEGFPNIVLEAMALGKPVLGTRVGAIPELLGEDGGLLVDPRSVPQLEEALARLMADTALRATCGQVQEAKLPQYTVQRACDTLARLWLEAAR